MTTFIDFIVQRHAGLGLHELTRSWQGYEIAYEPRRFAWREIEFRLGSIPASTRRHLPGELARVEFCLGLDFSKVNAWRGGSLSEGDERRIRDFIDFLGATGEAWAVVWDTDLAGSVPVSECASTEIFDKISGLAHAHYDGLAVFIVPPEPA
jgi:hypothetical protein